MRSRISIESQLNYVWFAFVCLFWKKNNKNSRRFVVSCAISDDMQMERPFYDFNRNEAKICHDLLNELHLMLFALLNVIQDQRSHTRIYVLTIYSPKTGNIYFVRLFVIDCSKSIVLWYTVAHNQILLLFW